MWRLVRTLTSSSCLLACASSLLFLRTSVLSVSSSSFVLLISVSKRACSRSSSFLTRNRVYAVAGSARLRCAG